MISGFRVTQMIHAAAELRVCDALAGGSRTAAEIAPDLGADPALLHRLCRGLAGHGVLAEEPGGTFSNTALGELLRSGVPGSLRDVALALPERSSWAAWAELTQSVREGAVPFQLANGISFWEANSQDEAVGDRFNRFMVAQTEVFVPQLLAAFDFGTCRRVVDVGGGNGALLAGVLAANRQLRGTLFDLPEGLAGADAYLTMRGVRDRCELVKGDFFEAVPSAADAYLLRLILHDWDDGRAAAILANCRAAMAPGTRLIVIDNLLPEVAGEEPQARNALTMDLHMHVLFGARERTESHLRQMLETAGFSVTRVVPTAPPSTIVCEARP